jgi:hypothetical protein
MVATTVVAPSLNDAPGDNCELKYTLPAGRVDLARRILDATCRPDDKYPCAYVSTIYYDTPQRTSLFEKANSDYLKLKVRLRWYTDLDGSPSGLAFIEAKRRIGSTRDKVRLIAPYSADEIAGWDLQDARLRPLPLMLRTLGVNLQGIWQPAILIRYRRDRFVEPLSRTRVNLDSEIVAAAAAPGFVPAADPEPLGVGVLEVKGPGRELPLALGRLVPLGARKVSFSKFLAVQRHAAHTIS